MSFELLPHVTQGLHDVLLDRTFTDAQLLGYFPIFLTLYIAHRHYLLGTWSQLVQGTHDGLYLLFMQIHLFGIETLLANRHYARLHLSTTDVLLSDIVETDIFHRRQEIRRQLVHVAILQSTPNQFESISNNILACLVIMQDAQGKIVGFAIVVPK